MFPSVAVAVAVCVSVSVLPWAWSWGQRLTPRARRGDAAIVPHQPPIVTAPGAPRVGVLCGGCVKAGPIQVNPLGKSRAAQVPPPPLGRVLLRRL